MECLVLEWLGFVRDSHVDVRSYVGFLVCICVYIYIHIIYTYNHTRTHTHTYIYIHIYICIHIYVYNIQFYIYDDSRGRHEENIFTWMHIVIKTTRDDDSPI